MSKNAQCYKEDGTPSSDIPCGSSTLSTCCGANWDCLTNGLCRQHGTTAYSQGTCTNPKFDNCLSFCNHAQFRGFTEVSRCQSDSNSWCCAGAAGQGLGGPDCCTTNLTTSLEPYPFFAIGTSQSQAASTSSTTSHQLTSIKTTTTSVLSSATLTSNPLSSNAGSSATSESQTSLIVPTSSAASQPNSQDHSSRTGIEVGVPLGVVILLLCAGLAFVGFRRYRKRKRGLVHLPNETQDGPSPHMSHRHELDGAVVGELDVTHYELNQPNAPRHELG